MLVELACVRKYHAIQLREYSYIWGGKNLQMEQGLLLGWIHSVTKLSTNYNAKDPIGFKIVPQ